MKYDFYKELKTTNDFTLFDFMSVGPKGLIPKRIEFMPTEIANYVNLAFGNIDENGEIDDYIISDNGDRNKILATVAYTVDLYLNKYPDKLVYFKGSTQERTRLYRMAVGLNLDELLLKFDIYAQQENGFIDFQKNTDALGFLVKRK